MSKFHVKAIFEQFAWLEKHFPFWESSFQDGTVGRFTEELLCKKAGYWSLDIHGDGHNRIFLFSSSGRLICNVDPKRPWISYFVDGAWQRRVDDTMSMLGDQAREVYFAVEVSPNTIKVYRPLEEHPPYTIFLMKTEADEAERRQFTRQLVS